MGCSKVDQMGRISTGILEERRISSCSDCISRWYESVGSLATVRCHSCMALVHNVSAPALADSNTSDRGCIASLLTPKNFGSSGASDRHREKADSRSLCGRQ